MTDVTAFMLLGISGIAVSHWLSAVTDRIERQAWEEANQSVASMIKTGRFPRKP